MYLQLQFPALFCLPDKQLKMLHSFKPLTVAACNTELKISPVSTHITARLLLPPEPGPPILPHFNGSGCCSRFWETFQNCADEKILEQLLYLESKAWLGS
eukprot:gb/GEZN01017828.1/.p1 GENE.gb/GEZN01017828.1/~~gb/GEZN01017828.1/.p1  ORF type:complete len:100 (+),score=7.16 gb/GEZN01017828.1/:427-726(+)